MSLTDSRAQAALLCARRRGYKSAVKDYYDKNGIEYDHSKFPECEDCESCGCRMV